MAKTVVGQDKILGAAYGFILSNALMNRPSSQYLRYSKYIKLELNFRNLGQIDKFFDFFKKLSDDKNYICAHCVTFFNGLMSAISQDEEAFKNILPDVVVYSLLNANNDNKRAFSDLSLLVYSNTFSDNLLYASFSVYLILQCMLNGNTRQKGEILDNIREVIFRELKGLTTCNDVFYQSISDKDLYRLSKERNVWNSMLISFGVLKTSDDYLEGIKRIILLGGCDMDVNAQLYGLFFGALYGVASLPSEYVAYIDTNLPAIVLFTGTFRNPPSPLSVLTQQSISGS